MIRNEANKNDVLVDSEFVNHFVVTKFLYGLEGKTVQGRIRWFTSTLDEGVLRVGYHVRVKGVGSVIRSVYVVRMVGNVSIGGKKMDRNILKEMEDLMNTKAKYDNMKTRYVEYAKKLKQASELLAEVANDIDPFVNNKNEVRIRGRRGSIKEISNEVKEKLQSGVEISTDFLVKAYPDLEIGQIRGVLQNVRKMQGIKHRKEAQKVFFFYPKDWK